MKRISTLHTFANGAKMWLLPNGLLHRLDGPAAEYPNGSKSWVRNGNLHRTDGPAMISWNGEKSWWLKGIQYNCLEWMLKVH